MAPPPTFDCQRQGRFLVATPWSRAGPPEDDFEVGPQWRGDIGAK